jgi:hypothetical protein
MKKTEMIRDTEKGENIIKAGRRKEVKGGRK